MSEGQGDVAEEGGAWRPRLAIGLVSAAVLVYEIAVTRVLSVVLWYHFAFLSISLAMLGLGLPGVWFSLRRPGPRALPIALAVAGLAVPGSLILLFGAGEIVTKAQSPVPGLGILLEGGMLLVIVALLVPLLALGSAVCLLLMRAEGPALGRMYGADLLGATVGAVLVVPLLGWAPTPLVVAGAGLLPLVAALLVSRRAAVFVAPVALVVVGAMLWGKPFKLRVSKGYVEPANLLFEKWTPTARITVFPEIFYLKDKDKGFGWGMGSKYQPVPLEQLWLEQDGSAGTPITRLSGKPTELQHLLYDVTSAGYQIRPAHKVAVIGAGGGRDVLTALAAGAQAVDAVELNPATVGALSGPFRDFSGDVYHLPGVNAVIGEGRSFLTHASGGYDLIQISLIDSWAATAAGAFALSENYLYTVEALRLYLQRTAPGGMVSISRWMAGDRQLEGARLSELALEALRREGAQDPTRHIAVVQAWSVGTFLLSKTPFDGAALAKLDAVCDERGFRRHFPVNEGTPGDSIVARVLTEGTASFHAKGLDLAPPTDDRPFFFQTVSMWGPVDREALAALSNNEQSVGLLRSLLWLMTVMTLGLFFAPFLLRRVQARAPWRGSAYFATIGIAFMLAEMPWLQRFVLYLGHPSYATTVVLATLLLGAGLGAWSASRIGPDRVRRYGLLLPLALVALDLLLGPIFAATLGASFPARIALSAALLLPTGFLMGVPFPAGMAAFGDLGKPWFWAMNGAAGVLGSVLALGLSIALGFFAVGLIGAALYAVAFALLVLRRPETEVAAAG